MVWLTLSSGLLLGLGSATHCAGMCGPIALVLPFQRGNGRTDWTAFSVYHIGRVFAYLSIGLLIGWIGSMIQWQGLGAALSLLSGVGLLLYGLHYMRWISIQGISISFPVQFIKKAWTMALSKPNRVWFFPAGFANGLLPCGMVYAAATVALGMRYMEESFAVMAGFALGTLPVFFILPIFRRYMKGKFITGSILLATALWLLYRGGIALYHLSSGTSATALCHG